MLAPSWRRIRFLQKCKDCVKKCRSSTATCRKDSRIDFEICSNGIFQKNRKSLNFSEIILFKISAPLICPVSRIELALLYCMVNYSLLRMHRSLNFRNGRDMTNYQIATNMRDVDFYSLTSTRRGLMAIKSRWLDVVDFSDYAEEELLKKNLEERSVITVPLFATKYNWDGSGKEFFPIPFTRIISKFRNRQRS